ncbi:exodeoxyribonuclease VII small subunit [Anaerolineae bacterium CFX7]|nr:exodeoxyribonuclease VII small subunit [Anaerolineae bacterium CFX7]
MPKKNPTAALSFEELYSKLQAIIETLEGGNLTLDEALALYEQGMALAQQCNVMLDNAELRIQELAPAATDLDAESDLEFLDNADDE